MSGDIFGCDNLGGVGVLFASRRWRPGRLLNTLQ